MADERTWRRAGVDFYVEADPAIPFDDDPEPVRLPTTGERPAERVPIGSIETEPAPALHVEAGEHFELPAAGFLGEGARLARESTTVKEEVFTVATGEDVLTISNQPLDAEIPLTIEGEGEVVARMATVQHPDESRRLEEGEQ